MYCLYYLLQNILFFTDLYEKYLYSFNMETFTFICVTTNPDANGKFMALALHSQSSQPTYTGKNNN